MRSASVFGDSILKGVQFEGARGRYVVNDNLGLSSIAASRGLYIKNFSKFGCTITKAYAYVLKMFHRIDADMVLMNFGGNDCDYNWAEIAKSPLDIHSPNTDLELFVETYNKMVDHVVSRRSVPVLATLVPVEASTYVDHVCRTQGLDRQSIDLWARSNSKALENNQSVYSEAVRDIARSRGVPLVDLRGAMCSQGDVSALLCEDGIHPNDAGQKVIKDCFEAFMGDYLSL